MENIEVNEEDNNKEKKLSSDEEFESEEKMCEISKEEALKNININNEDIIDEKEEIRQSQENELHSEEETLQEIIKEEHLEQQELVTYDELEIENEIEQPEEPAKLIKSTVEIPQKEELSRKLSEEREKSETLEQPQLSKTVSYDERLSTSKSVIKSITNSNTTKYLQSNSPELFVSHLSMLPNEVICIENNSTRIVVHMNKKIVPIPSSYSNESKAKRESPEKNKTTLPSVQHPYLLGKLIVTNYKLAYMDLYYPNTMTFCLPLNYILKIERTNEQSTGVSYLEIWFKTGLNIKMKFHQEEFSYSLKLKDIILTLVHKNLFAAVDYGVHENNANCLCKKYTQNYFNEESTKQSIKGIDAEIVENTDWKEMSGYPERYVVPLKFIGKRNSETRIVVLSYLYSLQNEKIGLWRTGPGNPDPFEDEWISKARFSTNHYIIEVKNKGIGISKSQAHRSIELESLYILRESYFKVHQLTYHNHDSLKWLGNLCSTKWYEQVVTLMNEAMHVIEIMSSKVNVTLVCDTEGRGTQIASIVQLLMNPFYRTFEGFPHLIEKEFLHFGCPKSGKKEREEDKTIILIQFLDCVFQFTHLYPLSFEFNEHYLVFLAEHVFSNKYGNFLYISRQLKNESDRREVVEKCVCIWSDIKRRIERDMKLFSEVEELGRVSVPIKKSNRKSISSPPVHELMNFYIYFVNSFYIDHNESNIFELRNHSEVSKGIKLWASYFSKKVYCSESIKEQVLFCNQIEKRYFKIFYEHNLMKKYNENMRKKLSEQYSKIVEKKRQIKNLKEL